MPDARPESPLEAVAVAVAPEVAAPVETEVNKPAAEAPGYVAPMAEQTVAPLEVSVQSPTPEVVEKPDLGEVLQASGLQLVETRVTLQVEPEPAFVPAKRERRPAPSSMNAPLVQVETDGKTSPPPPA